MKEGDVMTEDGRPLTLEQAIAREKVWRAQQNGVGVTLGHREAKALYETILADAQAICDPEGSLRRAVQYLRNEGRSDRDILDLVRKIVAETTPFRLGIVRAEDEVDFQARLDAIGPEDG
jgi:hypothetical protein